MDTAECFHTNRDAFRSNLLSQAFKTVQIVHKAPLCTIHFLTYFIFTHHWMINETCLPILDGSLATTAWCVLRLWMEERPPAMEGSCAYIE